MTWIVDNWQLKLLALILSLGLFAAVAFQQNPVTTNLISAPIQYDQLSPSQSIFAAPTTEKVTLTGLSQNVRIAGPNNVSIHVDASRLKIGTQIVVGRPRVAVPGVGTIEDQIPFTITVDERTTLSVQVEARINYAEGWKPVADKIVVTPSRLTFVGAASQLKDLKAFVAPAAPIGVSSADIPSLPIQLERNGRPATIPTDTTPSTTVDSTLNASLHVEAQRPNQTRRVPVLETPTGTPAAGFRITAISIDPLFIDVSGAVDVLTNVSSVALPPISVDGQSSTITRTVRVNTLPANITSSASTVLVTITIQRNPLIPSPSPT